MTSNDKSTDGCGASMAYGQWTPAAKLRVASPNAVVVINSTIVPGMERMGGP